MTCIGLYTAATAFAAPGGLDPLDLNVIGNHVTVTAVQPDGKTIIAGRFTSILGVPRGNIARLNADGTLDTGFDPKTDLPVMCVTVQADGKILLAGEFTTLQPNGAVAATSRKYVARLNADGTLDTSFDPSADNNVYGMAVQTDGKILIGGSFQSLRPNGAAVATTRRYVARLNADGTIDSKFNLGVNATVNSVAVQADGKILIGGSFTLIEPNLPFIGAIRRFVARLNADGTLDAGFDPKADLAVVSIALQADGKILIGGSFTTLQPNGARTPTARQRIARLNADGTLDSGFDPKADRPVRSLTVQADGKILLGGAFTTLQPNGTPNPVSRQCFARLNGDGSLDPDFDPMADIAGLSVAVQANGMILLGGYFATLQPNGAASAIPRNFFARFANDAATQTLSVPSAGRVEWLRGGASPEAVSVTFELSTDGGNVFAPLGRGTRIGGGWELTGLSLPSSGHLRARAWTAGGFQNGTSGLVESVTAFVLPTVTRVTPASGTALGGTSVTIFGTNFTGASSVTFGGVAATSIQVVSSTEITAITTAHAPGTVDVAVTTPDGLGTGSGLYTYVDADLEVSFSDSSSPVIAGTDLTCTIGVRNKGSLDAENVAISQALPPGTTFVSLSLPAGWSATTPPIGTNGTVRITKPLVVSAGTATFILVTHLASSVADGTNISNTVSVSSATIDTATANNSATDVSVVMIRSDLAVTITGTPDNAPKGSNVTYQIKLSNKGPSHAVAPNVSLPLPSQMTLVSVTAPTGWSSIKPAIGTGGTVVYSAPSLANGAKVNFTVVAKVKPTASTGAILTAIVTTNPTDRDPVQSNNYAADISLVGTLKPSISQPVATGIGANSQAGLFDVIVKVTNTTPLPLEGFRLHVDFDAFKAAYPSLRLENASSPSKKTDVFVNYPNTVALNATVSLKLSFYTSTRTFPSPFAPVLTVDPLPSTRATLIPAGAVQASISKQAKQAPQLTFPTVAGHWYRVRYSSDLVHWTNALLPVQADSNSTTWTDHGPPYTESAPGNTPSRYYTVDEVASP